MALHFIEKADFITIIAINALDQLSGSDDSIVLEMADVAVEEMKSYLVARYDVVTIFNMDGPDRNKMLLMFGKDIALYHLHCRHHLKAVPEMRVKRYHQALQWMADVCAQKINPINLPDGPNTLIRAGGNTKRENHQY